MNPLQASWEPGPSVQILYVTSLWSGLADLIVHGRSEATGMPAFLRPLRALVESGHRVDVIAAGAGAPLGEVRVPWLREVDFQLIPWPLARWRRIAAGLQLLRSVRAALCRQRYDFVYGHGRTGAVGCLAARQAGIACGQRLYGVYNLLTQLERRPPRAIAVSEPLLYSSFRMAKDFLLITNDGSHGDRAWQRLGRPGAFEFHFWRNGVDFPPTSESRGDDGGGEPFLFMPARITAWKRQIHALEILRQLHAMGRTDLKLYLAGPVADPAYWATFEQQREAYGLGPSVRYLGALPAAALAPYYRRSLAILAPYEQASLGNVVIEGLAAGGIVVAQDSDALDGVIRDADNGLRVSSPAEAAARLVALLEDVDAVRAMRARASASARQTFEPWDQRTGREIQLIETHIARRGA